MKIRIGNDFKTKWAITWLGEPEDFSDATDIALFFNIYDKKIELTKDVDYTITNNIIEIDVTPDICNILGVYNLELHYTKPNDDFIDGERRSAVDIDAFRIVSKSEKADATQDVSIISDAVAIFLDIAYKKLEEIEANEDVRVANENTRISNEQDRQINTTTAISNAEQATLNANNSATYANEQGSYAEEMSSHPPTIINDYWHIWNLSTNQYESTGQYARGDSAVDGALVVQEKGQSAVNTMSQKAVTDELVQLAGEVSEKIESIIPEAFIFDPSKSNILTGSTQPVTDFIKYLRIEGDIFKPDGSIRRMCLRNIGHGGTYYDFGLWAESDEGAIDGSFYFLKRSTTIYSLDGVQLVSTPAGKTITVYCDYDFLTDPHLSGGTFSNNEILKNHISYLYGGLITKSYSPMNEVLNSENQFMFQFNAPVGLTEFTNIPLSFTVPYPALVNVIHNKGVWRYEIVRYFDKDIDPLFYFNPSQTHIMDGSTQPVTDFIQNIKIAGDIFKPDGSIRRMCLRNIGHGGSPRYYLGFWAESDEGVVDGSFYFSITSTTPIVPNNLRIASNTGGKEIFVTLDFDYATSPYLTGGTFETTELMLKDYTILEHDTGSNPNTEYDAMPAPDDIKTINISEIDDQQIDYLRTIQTKAKVLTIEEQEMVPSSGVHITSWGGKLYCTIGGEKFEILLKKI